ncbi:MAG: trypsin-like serine peptidase, partial [Planctomycetota bacterium]
MPHAARHWLGAIATFALTGVAGAQIGDIDAFDVDISFDSGVVVNDSGKRATIYKTLVQANAVSWMRIVLDEATLGAAPAGGAPTVLRVTSVFDGQVQHLDRLQLQRWGHKTAYFNGNALMVELIADPGAGPSRVSSGTATVGPLVPAQPETICGDTDDRVPSFDDRIGRTFPNGCTAWLIDDANHCFLTAGHCTGGADAVHFNVPLSSSGGGHQQPPVEDQYPIDFASMQSNGGGGTGNDWAYFGCFANSETGLTAAEAQGDWFVLAAAAPPVSGQTIRITGYGSTGSSVPPEWNGIQKTHTGPFVTSSGNLVQYATDTTGGNSGSPVIDEGTGLAIGIHTHGGCSSSGGQNSGTGIQHPALQNALANPQGVCIPLLPLAFTVPGGVPAVLDPNGTSFLVNISGQQGNTPQPGSGTLHVDTGSGYTAIPMTPLSGNNYSADFPPIPCGADVSFYFSAETTGGETVTDPGDAPTTV